MDKFLSRRPTFRGRNLACAPDQARKKNGPLKTKVHALDIYSFIYLFTYLFIYLFTYLLIDIILSRYNEK